MSQWPWLWEDLQLSQCQLGSCRPLSLPLEFSGTLCQKLTHDAKFMGKKCLKKVSGVVGAMIYSVEVQSQGRQSQAQTCSNPIQSSHSGAGPESSPNAHARFV